MESCMSSYADFQGYFCAGDGKDFYENGREYTPDSCKGDSGSPLTYKDSFTGRYQLLGLVSWGSKQCGTTQGSIYVNVTHYLAWIHRTKLLDAVLDYNESGKLPYEKMDSKILHEMFDYINQHK